MTNNIHKLLTLLSCIGILVVGQYDIWKKAEYNSKHQEDLIISNPGHVKESHLKGYDYHSGDWELYSEHEMRLLKGALPKHVPGIIKETSDFDNMLEDKILEIIQD